MGTVGLQLLVRVTIIISVILLYANFNICSFLQLGSIRGQRSFGLCALIPRSTATVLRASHVTSLIRSVGRLGYDGSGRFLCMSRLFICLGGCLCALIRSAPRKLDGRVGGVLVDFRRPSAPVGRMLCYDLNSNSCRLIRSFIRGCYSDSFPSGCFSCGKRRVHVCPVTSNHFLTTCFAPSFLIMDFRGHLVRRIVSTQHDGGSLVGLPSFHAVCTNGRDGITTAICIHVGKISVKGPASNVHSRARLND